MAKCEHCEYPRATRRWCPRCSSVDPFPTRRRIAYLAGALLLAAGGVAITNVSPKVAQIELSKTMARTEFFAAPRHERLSAVR